MNDALRRAVDVREALDVGLGKAGDLGDPRRREARQHLGFEPVEADRVRRDVVAVDQPVAHQDVHDPERQRRVGADADLQVPVGLPRGAAACADRSTTSWTPRRRAASALAQKCTLVATRSAPQATIRSLSSTASGSAPPTGPTVMFQASSQHVSQTVPAISRLAPSAWNRPSIEAAVHLPLMRAVGVAEQRQRPGLGDDPLASARRSRRAPRPSRSARICPRPWARCGAAASAMRSGECTSSASRLTLAQANPAVNGCSGSPRMRSTRPSSTSASSEHMSGQSCAQTTRIVSMLSQA